MVLCLKSKTLPIAAIIRSASPRYTRMQEKLDDLNNRVSETVINLEKGYDTVLKQDAANLSQGQRQLLNIARAAISKAPILVLDEATSSVDTRTERHIEEGMDAIMKGRTPPCDPSPAVCSP